MENTGTDVVSAVFDPVLALFSGSIAPAVGIATVAVLGLSIAVARVKGSFKGGR